MGHKKVSEIIKKKSGLLNEFLRMIAEESVRKSLEDIEHNTQQERIKQFETGAKIDQLTASITKTSKEKPLEEKDDDSEDLFAKSKKIQKEKPAEKAPDKKAAEPAPEAAPEPEEKEPAGAPDEPAAGHKNITFSMIKDRLNTIRSGRSLRDKEIRQNLKTYFKELSDEEQQELHTLLDNVAKILTAGIEASDGQPPDEDEDDEDDDNDSSENDSKPEEKPKTKAPKQNEPAPQPVGSGTGIEDTSPPIDVGRKQRVESLRRHIKNLMN